MALFGCLMGPIKGARWGHAGIAMVPIEMSKPVLRGLPVERSQCVEVVLVGHRWQSGEHVAKIRDRILSVPLTRDDDQ